MKKGMVVALNVVTVVVASTYAGVVVGDFGPNSLASNRDSPMSTTTIALVVIIALVAVGALAVTLTAYTRRAKVPAESRQTNPAPTGWVLVSLAAIYFYDAATDSDWRFLTLAMGVVLLVQGTRMLAQAYRGRSPSQVRAEGD